MTGARIGIVMLVHEHVGRVAELANHWVAEGAPVAIHADRRLPAAAMADLAAGLHRPERIRLAPRRACEWGTFSLVAATNDAAALLLDAFPEVTHVLLTSGACVPLRPRQAIEAFLDAHPDTDFIQSVACEDVDWLIGGLNHERFTLRFPFAWKRRRALFDGYVDLQRRVGFARGIPAELTPHLGSQWWCLTRRTLTAILNAPERPRLDRYFRRVWIPDESYYQSLARRHCRNLVSRSLTFARFDSNGRPFALHDDHLPALTDRGEFLARKVWHGADAIFAAFLGPEARRAEALPSAAGATLDQRFDAAERQRRRGRPGLWAQHRFPRPGYERGKTRGRYTMLFGFEAAFPGLRAWLPQATGAEAHGRLFHPQRARFGDDAPHGPGGLSDAARPRDHDPARFLCNLVWAARGRHQLFLFEAGDSAAAMRFVATDPNATVAAITGAWLLPLLAAGLPFDRLRKTAARLHREEAAILRLFDDPATGTVARIHVTTLRQALAAPQAAIDAALGPLPGWREGAAAGAPPMASAAGLDPLLERLRNSGIEIPSVGAFGGVALAAGPALAEVGGRNAAAG